MALQGKSLRPEDLDGPLALLTGTRPGIIKFSPIFRELERRGTPYLMIHSGQHYSPEMDGVFFDALQLRAPDHRLDVVRHRFLHGEQTAEMLAGIERILIDHRPQLLLVGGDCNTHLAGALAARKLHVPIGHVEAGMRSYDWRMPEEHNRVIIDHISELLFVHDERAREVLSGERVRGQVHVVGSTIADAVAENVQLARRRRSLLAELGVEPRAYLLATVHREENVDDAGTLRALVSALQAVGRALSLAVLLPAHPRTRTRLAAEGLGQEDLDPVRLLDPLGYLEFLMALDASAAVITDSGGVQQEACILRMPCVTVRPSTEWQETLQVGANRLVEPVAESMVHGVAEAVATPRTWDSPFPDGASKRIVDVAEGALAEGAVARSAEVFASSS